MRVIFITLLIFSFVAGSAQSGKRFHAKAVLADTHNDVLSSGVLDGVDISHRTTVGHTDLDRLKEGGVDIQFFSVWTGEKPRTANFYADALQEIDSLNKLLLKNPSRMRLVLKFEDVKRTLREEKLAALIGVEGGHMILDDLAKLDDLAARGMRYLTLTWNNSTSWASSAMDETQKPDSLAQLGLTEFGKRVVRRMNDLRVIVDLSHVGERTFYDAIETTSKPVFLSHSSVWSICPVFRNLKDEQIKAVARNGGVICINFYSGFISRKWNEEQMKLSDPEVKKSFLSGQVVHLDPVSDSLAYKRLADSIWRVYRRDQLNRFRPTIAELVDHIDHIVKLVGDRYVGIGSDFDGVSSLPIGLEDVTTYPKITEELVRRGYSRKSIKRILGGNVLRVMKANFK